MISRERLISSIQYATGWLLILLFGYSFVLPVFVSDLPAIPLIFPALILTFFTHAGIGVRSTTVRYRLWRPWLDLIFLLAWILACLAFVIIWSNG